METETVRATWSGGAQTLVWSLEDGGVAEVLLPPLSSALAERLHTVAPAAQRTSDGWRLVVDHISGASDVYNRIHRLVRALHSVPAADEIVLDRVKVRRIQTIYTNDLTQVRLGAWTGDGDRV